MTWIALLLLGVAGLAIVTDRGRDALAGLFSRGALAVTHVVGVSVEDVDAVRRLRAFRLNRGEAPAEVVLASDQRAVAEGRLRREGETGAVDCLRPPYRVVYTRGRWAVVAVPRWLSFLARVDCEHGSHDVEPGADPRVAALRDQFAAQGPVEALIVRGLTDPGAVLALQLALLDSEVWLVDAAITVASDAEPARVRLRLVPWQGRDVLPVFTSEARIPPVPPGTSVSRVPMRTLLAVLPEEAAHPFVVNPTSVIPVVLTLAELRAAAAPPDQIACS